MRKAAAVQRRKNLRGLTIQIYLQGITRSQRKTYPKKKITQQNTSMV